MKIPNPFKKIVHEAAVSEGVDEKELESVIPETEDENSAYQMSVEFKKALQELSEISKSGLSVADKRARLAEKITALSESTFVNYFPKIMEIIQHSKDKCEPYKDTEAQVQAICEMIPRMESQRHLVEYIIRERRHKYGLKV